MKKILFFLLMALSVAAFSQGKKISDLTESSTMLPNGVLEIEQGGSSYSISKSDLQKTLRDSLKTAYTLIYELFDRIDNLRPPDDATLQAYYKFEESLLDETAYDRVMGASLDFYYVELQDVFWVGGFDTITRRTRIHDFDQTDDFIVSVDAFVYNDSTGNRTIAAGDGWKIAISSDTLKFVTEYDSVYATGAITPDTLRYRAIHIAATSDGELWVNGDKLSVTGGIVSAFDSNGDIYIGSTQAATESFYGYLDNFKIWTGVMDSTDLVNEYKTSQYYNVDDITRPVINNATVNIPTAIEIRFSENVYNFDEAGLISALTYTANGANVTIDSIDYESYGLTITIYTDSIGAGNTLKLSYDTTGTGYTGLEDWAGNKLSTIYERTVTNNYEEAITDAVIIRYPFDGNGTDVVSGYNTVDTTDNPLYSSTIFAEGTQSMIINGSTYRSWVPASYDDNPDTLTFKAIVRLIQNSGNYDLIQNYSATPFRIEWRAPGNDIYVYAGGTYSYATNIAGSSDATPTGTWRTLVVTYVKSSGNVQIYVDGVNETDGQGAASGADLSGPYKFGLRFYIDDVHFYHILADQAEVSALGTPGYVIQRGGAPVAPPAPSAGGIDTLFYFDFEDSDLGYYSQSQFTTDFSAERSTNSAWNYSGYTSANRPEIVSEAVYINGVLSSTKRLRLTKVANTTNAEQTPMNARCIPFPRDENNTDVYLSYDLYTPNDDWKYVTPSNTTGGNPAGKFSGFWCDYQKRFSITDVFTDLVRWSNWDSQGHRYTGYFGWPPKDEPELMALWYDPETGAILKVPHSATNDSVHRVTLRFVTGPNGFTEYFYNGVLVGTNYNHGKDMTGVIVDCFKFGYALNEDRSINRDIRVDFDNIFIFRYDPDYAEGYWMQPSPAGRILYDPLDTYR